MKVEVGDIVKDVKKKGWYAKVFEVNEKRGHHYPQVTVAVFCTSDGRPQRRVLRKVVASIWLDVVEGPPSRFSELGGRIPTRLPDPPGGTPRRKFTDSFALGDVVSVTRSEHGWFDGAVEGTIIEISDYCCTVRGSWFDEERTWDLTINRPGDIRLLRRASAPMRKRAKKLRRKSR
jgi:hypothetical protein